MGVTILFFSGMALIALWWLSKQSLASKPWLEQGEGYAIAASPAPAAKVGLGVLLAALGSLFALLVGAYLMRRQLADWRPVPAPILLWVNTSVLMLSGAALHGAEGAALRSDVAGVRRGLLAAGGTALAFLAGQVVAWRQLATAGYFLASNPASSFFYLVTALHGLHLLGGMVALGRIAGRAWRGPEPDRLRLSLELCRMYWDFLLLIWLVLFGLLLLT